MLKERQIRFLNILFGRLSAEYLIFSRFYVYLFD